MTNKNGIDFNEKGEEGPGKVTGYSARRPRSFLSRSLLLVLFLLLLCLAAGYYFLGNSLPPVAEKQPPALVPTPAGPSRQPAPVPLETRPAERPLQKENSEKPVARGRAATGPALVAPATGPEPMELSAPVARPDKYVLQGGPFLVPEDLARAEKTIRSLGFEPRLEKGRQTTKMTRLRVGRYPLEQARARARELKALAPDVFLLPKGDRTAVYAGSFSDTRRARDLAARLARQGVRVEEEPVQVTLPVTTLTFGGYADMATARQAAERARANGLAVLIVQRP
ncbi:MAG: SPOR domain-containing protein [Desulfobacterales bacterium]|nr:SPOR domain-containing protein [Desulfobacterales bacterium]